MKNRPMSDSKEARESLNVGERSPYPVWLISVVWLPLIIPAIVKLFQAHSTLPHLGATLVCVALFFSYKYSRG